MANAALTVVDDTTRRDLSWSHDQMRLVREVLTEDLTDQEFQLFGMICQRTGLDPFTKQIYAIKRVSGGIQRMVIQTGIDGYRAIAERTGEYVGGEAPVYGPLCPCGDPVRHPEWANVGVRRLKGGTVYLTYDRADFDEYCGRTSAGNLTSMWAKMPKRMIAKCAEALALRRAFPGIFDGVYTAEEMDQADRIETRDQTSPAVAAAPPAARVTSASAPRSAPVLGERSVCPECKRIGAVTNRGGAPKFYPNKYRGGKLECNGLRPDQGYWNHPVPVSDAERSAAAQMGDGEIPI